MCEKNLNKIHLNVDGRIIAVVGHRPFNVPPTTKHHLILYI